MKRCDTTTARDKGIDLFHSLARRQMRCFTSLIAVSTIRDDHQRVRVPQEGPIAWPSIQVSGHANAVTNVRLLESRFDQPRRPGVIVNAIALGTMTLQARHHAARVFGLDLAAHHDGEVIVLTDHCEQMGEIAETIDIVAVPRSRG